jgi:hypothetical protein
MCCLIVGQRATVREHLCNSPETPERRRLSRWNLDDLESKLGGFGLEMFDL